MVTLIGNAEGDLGADEIGSRERTGGVSSQIGTGETLAQADQPGTLDDLAYFDLTRVLDRETSQLAYYLDADGLPLIPRSANEVLVGDDIEARVSVFEW